MKNLNFDYQIYSDISELKNYAQTLSERIKENGNYIYPAWLDESPATLLQNNPFVVCGSMCRSEIRVLANNSCLLAIVDDELCKTSNTLFGVPIISTDIWIKMVASDKKIISCLLVSNSRASNHFIRQCVQHNIRYISAIQFLNLLVDAEISTRGLSGRFFNYGYEFFESTVNNISRLLALTDLFDDTYSKITFLNILLYRITLNPLFLEKIAVGHGCGYSYNSYSTNKTFFNFSDNEVYVDGGAFTGDTIERFIRSVDGKFKHIFSFEPSQDNNFEIKNCLRRLQDEFQKELDSSVSLIEKGLWNSTTELLFNTNGSLEQAGLKLSTQSAHFVESGMVGHIYENGFDESVLARLPVTTLDEATDGSASFIKLEIEGSELNALHGAKETIKRNRPKMAISIYHKPEDMLALTNFVIESGQNYKLGIRQHNQFIPDAMVLYCS